MLVLSISMMSVKLEFFELTRDRYQAVTRTHDLLLVCKDFMPKQTEIASQMAARDF